ncbi:MAG TPA: potassium-transporting ATPase subunit F [Candidatus Acidoferrales bacterium]|nr:potassium-transporting ATPase subunit F [Candidatus Acidoferrales bacterium]
MRPLEVGGEDAMLANILILIVCVLVFGYLIFAMLRPEKF